MNLRAGFEKKFYIYIIIIINYYDYVRVYIVCVCVYLLVSCTRVEARETAL